MQVAFTEIAALERVVSILAFGDILAENTRELTEVNFVHIFRLAQLALEYLLHVQDTLDGERRLLIARECARPLDVLARCAPYGCVVWQST